MEVAVEGFAEGEGEGAVGAGVALLVVGEGLVGEVKGWVAFQSVIVV